MTDEIEKIKDMMTAGHLDDALAAANSALLNGCQPAWEAYYLRGRIHWRMGDRRQAINDYHASVALNPHGPAEQALAQANEILSFFNPDIFNP